MNQHISLLLLAKNEQDNLSKNFIWLSKCPNINEVIIIDDLSTDNTQTIAKKLESKNLKVIVKQRKLNNDFSSQRSYGINQSKNNWILWLDADEIPSRDLIKFLNNFTPNGIRAYSFIRQNIFWKKLLKHGESQQPLIRLFNKTYGKFIGNVHESWISKPPHQKTKLTFTHQPNQDITSFLQKINFYTSIRAQELYKQKVKPSLFQIIIYPIAKFFSNYIIKLGFLDGIQGIIISLLMSFHSFLVRAKLWHLSQTSSST